MDLLSRGRPGTDILIEPDWQNLTANFQRRVSNFYFQTGFERADSLARLPANRPELIMDLFAGFSDFTSL